MGRVNYSQEDALKEATNQDKRDNSYTAFRANVADLVGREERKATRARDSAGRNNTWGLQRSQITGFDRSNTPET